MSDETETHRATPEQVEALAGFIDSKGWDDRDTASACATVLVGAVGSLHAFTWVAIAAADFTEGKMRRDGWTPPPDESPPPPLTLVDDD